MNLPNRPAQVLIIGPGPVQVGGVATFIQFILHSTYLNQRFVFTHMDTARKIEDLATTNRFSFLNMNYFVSQVFCLYKVLHALRPQIVHLSVTAGWSFWKNMAFLLMSRAFKAKVVAHMHGGAFNLFFERKHPMIRKLIAWSLNKADVVVALSTWWQEFYLEQISTSLNVAVIFNCPEESFSYCRNIHGLDGRAGNTILFVGSIGKRKGIFDILEAIPMVLRDFSSARFVFLGKEEFSGEEKQILDICRKTNLEGHVRFLGHVTGAEKFGYYQRSDIFILPSHAENLPFSILEAMAMRLPVITTPVGGIPEIVDDEKNGYLIQPGDAKELAKRILHLLKNPQIRAQMGKHNWEKIQATLQPESIAGKWERLYMQLLGSGKKPSPRTQTRSQIWTR